MLTLGKLLDDFQADYIPGLESLNAVKRSTMRVIDDLNSKMEGVEVFDKGLQMIVAPTTESVVFTAATATAGQTIVLTTTPTATVVPGDIFICYSTSYNNKAYPIQGLVRRHSQ